MIYLSKAAKVGIDYDLRISSMTNKNMFELTLTNQINNLMDTKGANSMNTDASLSIHTP